MDAFVQIFGKITIEQIAIVLVAISYLVGNIKKVYEWITTRHDELQQQENINDVVKSQQEKIDLLIRANLAMLSYHLFEACEKALTQGEITINELDLIKKLYEPYHALGGNGTGTKLYEDCLKLKLKR